MGQSMQADERAFHAHAERPDFLIGVAKKQWRLIEIAWPYAIISVTAHNGTAWPFRFLLDGYPSSLPNAQPWDLAGQHPLNPAKWPKGTGRVACAFNPSWSTSALYLPCDRLALPGHEAWLVQHPEKAWSPERGIIHYLEMIHDLLASHQHVPAPRAEG